MDTPTYRRLFFKYGITNRSVDTRIEEQSRSTEYEPSAVEVLHFGHGADAKLIEESYKDRYPTPGISKDLFGDGYTETFREN